MHIERAIFNSVQGGISEKIGKGCGKSLEIWCFFSNTLKHSVTNFLCTFCCKVHLVSVKLPTTEFTEYLPSGMTCARWISSLHPLPVRYVLLSSALTNEEAESQRAFKFGKRPHI